MQPGVAIDKYVGMQVQTVWENDGWYEGLITDYNPATVRGAPLLRPLHTTAPCGRLCRVRPGVCSSKPGGYLDAQALVLAALLPAWPAASAAPASCSVCWAVRSALAALRVCCAHTCSRAVDRACTV